MRPPTSERDYLSRGLLTCATCDTPMAPALWRELRVYACGGSPTRRVDAELVDSEVWTRLCVARPEQTRNFVGDARHDVIAREVARVRVTNPYPMTLTLRGDDDRT